MRAKTRKEVSKDFSTSSLLILGPSHGAINIEQHANKDVSNELARFY